jgi:hypothetical protein
MECAANMPLDPQDLQPEPLEPDPADESTPEAVSSVQAIAPVLRLGPAGRPPPHDLDAEAVVLAALLLQPERLAEVSGLEPQHFYSDPNRLIFAAIVELGAAADLLTVTTKLRDSGRLADAGGAKYLGQLLNDTPACVHLGQQAERVRSRAELRRLIADAQRLAIEGYAATDPELYRGAIVAAAGPEYAAIGARRGPELPWLYGAALNEPVPPHPWAVPALQLGPGRPAMIVAYAGTAKTIAMQSLLLAYAAGVNVWGAFPVNRGGVALHLDFEQGAHATRRRYQRLAYGMNVDLDEVAGRLGVISFPRLYLTDKDAEQALEREIQGAGIVLIDSFRAACPGVDENASEVRRYVDLLTRVSEHTGACIILIHHSGKEKVGHSDKRQIARGSSGIMDAVGCSYLITMTSYAEPRGISQTKLPAETNGTVFEDAFLAIQDVDGPSGAHHGLRIVHQTAGQSGVVETPKEELANACRLIVDTVRQDTGLSLRRLRALVGGGRAMFDAALELALERGDVETFKPPFRSGGGLGFRVPSGAEK